MVRRSALATAALATSLVTQPAQANGRFPTADQLAVDPEDSQHLVMGTTFGILTSDDGGRSFRWTCEEAVGYAGEEHPSLAIFAGGTLLAGFRGGLWASDDAGCSWERVGASDPVVDLTLATAERVLVLSHADDGAVGVTSVEGAALTPSELSSPGQGLTPHTIEVAASDPDRIYVSALSDEGVSLLLRSDDGGSDWERLEISPYAGLPAYVSAVDPNDPDRLYVRLDGETTDHLLLSENGGQSFAEIFALEADMLGFALSPDGERVAIGGPRAGAFLADADSLTFVPAQELVGYLSCLRWTESGLLACAREENDDWTVGISSDEGNSFTPLFRLDELTPQECPSSTIAASQCRIAWETIAPSLGIDPERARDEPQPETSSSGCACRAARRPASPSFIIGGLLLLLAALRRWARWRGDAFSCGCNAALFRGPIRNRARAG